MTRLRMLQLQPDAEQAPTWREEMVVAADTTARARLDGRDHLCCGNLGRAAILRTLAASLASIPGQSDTADLRRRWLSSADAIVAAVLERRDERLPRSMFGSALTEIPMPGLFTGLPGAGLMLVSDEPAAWVPQLML